MNLLISGGMGDGKTTLLRALASDIPAAERLVTVESDYELALDRFSDRHHEVVALEAREASVEDVGRISCADLVRWAMRMSADRVIVGEVLGDEIVPMLNAMNSGAAGSMCTLHGGGLLRRDGEEHLSASHGLSIESAGPATSPLSDTFGWKQVPHRSVQASLQQSKQEVREQDDLSGLRGGGVVDEPMASWVLKQP
jgi:hypothetical protein